MVGVRHLFSYQLYFHIFHFYYQNITVNISYGFISFIPFHIFNVKFHISKLSIVSTCYTTWQVKAIGNNKIGKQRILNFKSVEIK
mgnify:CR=1 FL=1